MGSLLLGSIELPETYGDIESFEEWVSLGELRVALSGLCVRREDGLSLTASAASYEAQEALQRASWELLERASIAEWLVDGGEVPSGDDWAEAKSNGVAIYSDVAGAQRRARLELEERHAVLLHWFTGRAPEPLSWAPPAVPGYRWVACLFQRAPAVVGVFAIPKDEERVLALGFGAHETSVASARDKALLECFQRMGFLLDERPLVSPPPFAPTPLYHQEFYGVTENARRLERWLDGGLLNESPILEPVLWPGGGRGLRYERITPEFLRGHAEVVRARSPSHLPLVFGKSPYLRPGTSESTAIHPIS